MPLAGQTLIGESNTDRLRTLDGVNLEAHRLVGL